eukprot:gb/GECG01000130.1/.p1 GENE.gb/GECG01000130.1/~~gb/GECG01000130.1/.p1  ORF type:complete len:199 (+),score=4.74 gb/GECG01000130.1/:1-597(+)
MFFVPSEHVYNPYVWVGMFLVATVLTHSFFAFIWTFPSKMRKLFGGINEEPEEASSTMARITINLRGFTTLGVVGSLMTSTDFLRGVSWTSPITYCGLALAVFGQALNAGVYKQLGTYGVYYGRELGVRNLPWTGKFPYSLGIPDPQYVGVELGYIGLAIATRTLPMVIIAAIGAVAYTITICVERFVEPGVIEKKKD